MAYVELDRTAARQGRLPPVCVYCGEAATGQRRRAFTGRTPITITAGGGLAQARLPVCDRHRGHTLKRRLVQLIFLVVWVALLVLLSQVGARGEAPGWLAGLKPYRGALILAMLAAFGLLVVVRFVAFYTDVRMASLSWTTLGLAGVSEEFVEACHGETRQTRRVAKGSPEVAEAVLFDEPPEGRPSARPRTAVRKPTGSGSGLLPTILLIAGFFALVAAGAAVLWYFKTRGDHSPVTLSEARITSALGIATHIQVDYRCRSPHSPEQPFVLVVEHDGRKIAQRSLEGSALRDQGALGIDVLGKVDARRDRLLVFLEETAPGAATPRRISNAVAVKASR